MGNKAYKKEGVFYLHGVNKWVYRFRDCWGNLCSSKSFSKWEQANDEYLTVKMK